MIGAAAAAGGYALRPSAAGITYVTARVDRGDVRQSVSASGTINPVKLVNVGTQVSGVIATLNADFNSRVKEGQVLAELDPALLKAQLQQSSGAADAARAVSVQAQANLRRVQALFAQQYLAQADLDIARQQADTARAQLRSAQAQVDRDRANLSYAVIKSPVSGVVVSRSIDVGQTVAASFQTPTLFTIAQDLKQMQIDTNLSEADVGNVRSGMPADFTVDAFQGRRFAGKVREVRLNPTAQQNVVTYDTVIDVRNDDLSLLPGMPAFVHIVQADATGVLRVPNAALGYVPATSGHGRGAAKAADEKKVYVLRAGKPEKVAVKTGISDGKFTEAVAGELHEGDEVITDDNAPAEKSGKSAAGGPGGPRLF